MISIVSITFNNFSELESTCQSVRPLLSSGLVEHVIINGGSCEKTKEFLKQYPSISKSEPDRGISDAFNKGLALATGKGVLFLNSGDSLLPSDYLAWADQQLDQFDFTYSDIIFGDQIAGNLRIRPHGGPIGRGLPYPHQTLIIRNELFKKIGGFELGYRRAMDYELVCRMLRAGAKGAYFPVATALMDGGGVSSTQEWQTIQESFRALRVHRLIDFKNGTAFVVRVQFFLIRKLLVGMGFSKLLRILKRWKRGQFDNSILK